jgi:tRNA pseudouridine38-40 synthase
MRMACGLAYEGTHYAGWQWQPHTATIQNAVEYAISRVATHAVRVTAAGRTDAGVHAKEQVVHFDTHCQRDSATWESGINYYLPHDIRLLWLKEVDDSFHARHSAESRTYRYIIYQGSMPWFRRSSWIMTRTLGLEQMQQAASHLLGEHDFSALRAAHCQSCSPIREVRQLTLTREATWITLEITANAFLHHMVRNIVGLLVDIGRGKRHPDAIPALLKTRDRRQSSITAPPQGLYLQAIEYPEKFQLPTLKEQE